jgi:hypothetical protein
LVGKELDLESGTVGKRRKNQSREAQNPTD